VGRLKKVARLDQPIEPMTLGNMRELGVRSLFVSCWTCHHAAVLSADRWSDDVAVPAFPDARPNWKEQPPRESLTGVLWRS
jgi:hypothetical protein